MNKDIENHFNGVVGLPVWNAKQGVGSFLTLEFGRPRIRKIEPNSRRSSRKVVVYGEFHLWIYDCHWEILKSSSKIADDKSKKNSIEKSLDFLNGQILVSVEFHESLTRFSFDLGSSLITSPLEIKEGLDQWILYRENHSILALTKDGLLNTG